MKRKSTHFISIKNAISSLVICLSGLHTLHAQHHVNREWDVTTGNPVGIQWTNSIIDSHNQLITVGNTAVSGQGANILTTKFDRDGVVLWQADFNTAGSANDYGIALTSDQSNNVYVVGTTDNSTTNNYDIVMLKYTSLGDLTWSAVYDSPYSLNDVATSVKINSDGSVYVCASSEGDTTNFDYLILKYDSSGSLVWSNRYDYASLIEIPIGIEIDSSGDIFITGASANSITDWDYTVVKYNSEGDYLGDIRNSMPGLGMDQPRAFVKDALGNIYITGSGSSNGINYDIVTIKLNASYQLQWTRIIDFAGKEDAATSIGIDDDGNVIIGGYVTKINNIKEAFALKYDADGNEIWRHHQPGRNVSEDAAIKAVDVVNGAIYFVADEQGMNGTSDAVIGKINGNGEMAWQKKLNKPFNEKPTSIKVIDDETIYVTAIKDSVTFAYETFKFSAFKVDTNVVFNANGDPLFKANELTVRFFPSVLNTDIIDDRRIEYGEIDKFLTPEALTLFKNAMKDFCRASSDGKTPCVTAVKVFKQLKSSYTETISRLGETIPVPDFWTTLLLVFPEGSNLEEAYLALQTIQDVVVYSEPNYIVELSSSNDPEYIGDAWGGQHSIHNNGVYPNAHINAEEAWEVYPAAGSSMIRCGIFDSGVEYKHSDFGYDGSDPASSKVVDGWDFSVPIHFHSTNVADQYGHGTMSAGVVGAIRNNNIGVAGIAGGNEIGNNDFSDKGVSLYSLKISQPPFFSSTLSYVYDAIVTSAIDNPDLDYGYGLHLSNNSWQVMQGEIVWFSPQNISLIKESVHFANRAKVTFVTSRGNTGANTEIYPALVDDDWVITVGGTGLNGHYKDENNGDPSWEPSHGGIIDIAAPSASNLTVTTGISDSAIDYNTYNSYNGTSAASPHVAGIAALMLSYFNDTLPSYRNLAPEDSEWLLQLSATDVNAPGYDDSTGWGRADAGRAMRFVERPWNDVKHFGTNSLSPHTKSKVKITNTQLIHLRERYRNAAGTWFQSGNYRVDTYRIDATVTHEIGSNDSIIAYWPRPSSSTVLEPLINNELLARERITIENLTDTSCTMRGYVYKVHDMSYNFIGWWPFDTTFANALFEYTILTRDKNAPIITTSLEEHEQTSWVNLFPNPTTDVHTLHIKSNGNLSLQVDLYDLQGRLIRNVYSEKTVHQEVHIQENVADLQSSIYYYRIRLGDLVKHLRFVKQ